MFTQRVRHLMPHHHGNFVVGQLELVQDAGVKRNLATGQAKRVDVFAAQQIHLPLPAAGPGVPGRRVRDDFGGNGPQLDQARVVGRCQGFGLVGLAHHLRVLLRTRLLHLLGRHQIGKLRIATHLHAVPRGAGRRLGASHQQGGGKQAAFNRQALNQANHLNTQFHGESSVFHALSHRIIPPCVLQTTHLQM